MVRIRKTRRWGFSTVILLKSSDAEDLGIEIGEDCVDIENIKIIKKEKETPFLVEDLLNQKDDEKLEEGDEIDIEDLNSLKKRRNKNDNK